MKAITEAIIRTYHTRTHSHSYPLPPRSVVTPAARDYLYANRIRLVEAGDAKSVRPERMTSLRGEALVPKTHPVIALRGRLDTLQAKLLLLMRRTSGGRKEHLAELLEFLREVMRCEVLETTLELPGLFGHTWEELHAMSHNPQELCGRGHHLPDSSIPLHALELNLLRAQVRELELCAAAAFPDREREDILIAMNRLSSGLYVLYLKELQTGEDYRAQNIPIEVSARHIHLSRQDVDALFGSGHRLEPLRELSQPGQYLCRERVQLLGPKGTLEEVAVLGPVRERTQVELSLSDGRRLGVELPINLSGVFAGAGDIYIAGSAGKVCAKGSAIAARAHIHMSPEDAHNHRMRDGQRVSVRVEGARPLTMEDIVVRVDPDFRLAMHIDSDEAGAMDYTAGLSGRILEVCCHADL